MTNKPIGFGILGCGVVAQYHIGAISQTDGAELMAVCDVSEERARETGEQQGVSWYTDHADLLARSDIQVVCVCTPSGMRIPVATDAAAAGTHLVIEKPLDVTLEKADRIIEAARAAGVELMGIFQLRYGEAAIRVRDAVQGGKLGRLVLGDAYIKWYRPLDYYDSADWRGKWATEGGGALMTQGSHTLDLLQWIMGPVSRVTARMGTLLHHIEVEDTLVAMLEYESGALGVVEASTACQPGMPARLEISGSLGTAAMEADQIAVWDIEGETAGASNADTSDVARAASDSKTFGTEGHKAQIAEMVRVLSEGGHPTIDGAEARRAVELIVAIYESAKTGKPVELPLS